LDLKKLNPDAPPLTLLTLEEASEPDTTSELLLVENVRALLGLWLPLFAAVLAFAPIFIKIFFNLLFYSIFFINFSPFGKITRFSSLFAEQ
jgi:hypothetical protein